MNTNQYLCNRIFFFLIHPVSQNGWSLTNSYKIFKNKTLPARQFHIWELGFTSHILAWEIKFPRSQKTNGNSTLLFLSGGSQSMYPITTSLWVHVHLRTFPHLALYLYFSFHITFHELSYFQGEKFLFILLFCSFWKSLIWNSLMWRCWQGIL